MPNDAPATSGASAPTAAATSNVALPTFSTTNPAPWFLRVEALFRIKKITGNTKSDYVIAALPKDVFNRISTWLAGRGSDTIPYDELKAKIINHCEPSPEEKSQRLLDLLRLPLGDQRPSDALYEIRNLTTILNADGSTTNIDLSRVLWLLRLPHDIRTHITDFTGKTDQELARQADSLRGTSKLALAHPSTSAAATTDPSATPETEDNEEDDENIAAAQQRRQRPSNHRQFSNTFHQRRFSNFSNQRQFSGFSRRPICHFHQRFGREARNCQPPCSYSKNL